MSLYDLLPRVMVDHRDPGLVEVLNKIRRDANKRCAQVVHRIASWATPPPARDPEPKPQRLLSVAGGAPSPVDSMIRGGR